MKVLRKKCQALFKYFPKINPIILQYKISSTSHYIKNIYIFIFLCSLQIITLNSSNSHIIDFLLSVIFHFLLCPPFFVLDKHLLNCLSASRLFSLSFVQKPSIILMCLKQNYDHGTSPSKNIQ